MLINPADAGSEGALAELGQFARDGSEEALVDGGRRAAAGVELRDKVCDVLDDSLERPQFLDASELARAEPLFCQVRFLLPPFRLGAGREPPVV